MKTLKERLNDDMKKAMKGKDSLRLSTIRLIKASVKNKEIDAGEELKDDDVIGIIATAIKQRKDSAEQYRQAERLDLAEKEEKEIVILMDYLPEQVGENEILREAERLVAEVGAVSIKDMGKVMKLLMPKFKGKAEGSIINNIVKGLLD